MLNRKVSCILVTITMLLGSFIMGCFDQGKDSEDDSIEEIRWKTPYVLVENEKKNVWASIFQDSNERFWITWSQYNKDYQIMITYSDDGKHWSTPKQITYDLGNKLTPSLIQDINGRYRLFYSHSGIKVLHSDDGLEWYAPTIAMSVDAGTFKLISDSENKYWIAYYFVPDIGETSDPGLSGTYISKSDAGFNWSNPKFVAYGTPSSIMQDSMNSYWLVSGGVKIYKSPEENIWELKSTISPDLINRGTLIEDNNNIYRLAWLSVKSNNNSRIMMTSSKDGENWGDTQEIYTFDTQVSDLTLYQDTEGRYWLMWSSDDKIWITQSY